MKVHQKAVAATLAFLLVLTIQGCANKKVATQIDQGIVTAAATFQDSIVAAHKAGKISDDSYGKIMYQMGTLWRLAGQYNALVRDWPGTGAPPMALVKIAGDISATIRTILDLLPNTDQQSILWAKQILTIVEAVTKIGGTDATH